MGLNETIQQFMEQAINTLNQRIDMKLAKYRTEDMSDMQIHEPVFSSDENTIHALLQYSGLALWMVEYGAGSKIDLANPYLPDYPISAARLANNYAFTGHEKGDIIQRPDGTSYVSTGKLRGRNLEKVGGSGNLPSALPPYIPQEAQHIIHQEISLWSQEVKPELENIIGGEIKRQIIEKIKGEGIRFSSI